MTSPRIVGYGVNGDPLHEGKLDLPNYSRSPRPRSAPWPGRSSSADAGKKRLPPG